MLAVLNRFELKLGRSDSQNELDRRHLELNSGKKVISSCIVSPREDICQIFVLK